MAIDGAGPSNSLADIAGLLVGHAWRADEGWLTGTTVVAPAAASGLVAGVDVRGSAPGTRELDLLAPVSRVERVHAVLLSGGSAYGLAAADGVMTRLAQAGRGLAVGPRRDEVVPIVPGAVIFDLGRGGDSRHRPGPDFGAAAYDAAAGEFPPPHLTAAGAGARGGAGAGAGAVAGKLKGGIGSASAVLPDGTTVAALAVVNALGSAVHPRTGALYGASFGLPGEFDWLRPASAADLRAAAGLLSPRRSQVSPLNTTIGVVATDVALTKTQCAKLAGAGQDGLARAIRPAHTMYDGDTIFALSVPGSTGQPAAAERLDEVLAAAADCFSRAVAHAMLAATPVTTAAGHWPAYLEVLPSVTGT